jgi:hypothetical protein
MQQLRFKILAKQLVSVSILFRIPIPDVLSTDKLPVNPQKRCVTYKLEPFKESAEPTLLSTNRNQYANNLNSIARRDSPLSTIIFDFNLSILPPTNDLPTRNTMMSCITRMEEGHRGHVNSLIASRQG